MTLFNWSKFLKKCSTGPSFDLVQHLIAVWHSLLKRKDRRNESLPSDSSSDSPLPWPCGVLCNLLHARHDHWKPQQEECCQVGGVVEAPNARCIFLILKTWFLWNMSYVSRWCLQPAAISGSANPLLSHGPGSRVCHRVCVVLHLHRGQGGREDVVGGAKTRLAGSL